MVAFLQGEDLVMDMSKLLACMNHARRAVDISMLGISKTFVVATKLG